MPIITLLTDFGTDDEYVGVIKGVILSICPTASVVDISHHIEPQNIVGAAFFIPTYPQYFPPGTIHVVVVDPGVGTERAIIAMSIKNQIFIAPDNGILTLLLEKNTPEALVRIEAPEYCLFPVGRTFQGRDVFAPIAAHLATGIDLKKLGSQLVPEQIVTLRIAKPYLSENNELIGQIVSIDRFGNLITDIEADMLTGFCREKNRPEPVVWVGDGRVKGMSDSYADVAPRKPVAVVGSRGCLEIAVNQGSAKKYFGARPGDPVRIKLAG